MKQKAIIIDLDGTFVFDPNASTISFHNPGEIDWDVWHETRRYLPHNEWCYSIIKNFSIAGYEIIYLTGRSSTKKGKDVVHQWLSCHSPTPNYKLYMRNERDASTPDDQVKETIYYIDIAPFYIIEFAIDDRKDICDMWKRIGVPYLYCGE